MMGNVEGYKFRKEGSHYVILNKTLTGKRESTITNKEKTVFIPFDSEKFNFCNISNKEVIFHVNLDEEVIISKEDVRYNRFRHTKLHKNSLTRRKAERMTRLKPILTRLLSIQAQSANYILYYPCTLMNNYLKLWVPIFYYFFSTYSKFFRTLSDSYFTRGRL